MPGASRSTRAERKNTTPSCARNSTEEEEVIRRQRAREGGELEMTYATAAVTARPTHIHP